MWHWPPTHCMSCGWVAVCNALAYIATWSAQNGEKLIRTTKDLTVAGAVDGCLQNPTRAGAVNGYLNDQQARIEQELQSLV